MCVQVTELGCTLLTAPGDTPATGSPSSPTPDGAVFKLIAASDLMPGTRS